MVCIRSKGIYLSLEIKRKINIDLLIILGTIVLSAFTTVILNKNDVQYLKESVQNLETEFSCYKDKSEARTDHLKVLVYENRKDIAVLREKLKGG